MKKPLWKIRPDLVRCSYRIFKNWKFKRIVPPILRFHFLLLLPQSKTLEYHPNSNCEGIHQEIDFRWILSCENYSIWNFHSLSWESLCISFKVSVGMQFSNKYQTVQTNNIFLITSQQSNKACTNSLINKRVSCLLTK